MVGPFQISQAQNQQGEGRGQQFGARQNPYLPPGPAPLICEKWNGINTNTTRAGVPDDQLYWCDGFIPLDQRNLRTLYGIGSVAYTASGTTVVFFDFANIGSTPIMVVFLADGSVVQVNTTTLATTTILTAGTITSPSITTVGMTQWGSQYVIIVADQTNGYWVWDGATVFKAGTLAPTVTITNVGSGYTATPTVVLTGGSGIGSSLTASISNGQVVAVSVINPGSGYLATDNVSIAFIGNPVNGSGGTIIGTSFTQYSTVGGVVSASLSQVSITSAGANYSSHPTLSFVQAITQLVSATAFANTTNGTITSVSITNGGIYRWATGSSLATIFPTISITDTAVTAAAIPQLMPYGIQGTAAETYSGHVWVIDGATLYWTAPGAIDDFSTSNGGGNATSNSSTLKVGYTQLIAANGFLYLIGDSSVQYISGVQTSGTPPETTFTQQDADPEVGSPYPQSVIAFGRNVLFANSYGVHAVFGGAVRKISEMLDGIYSGVANFGGLQLSSAQATMFGNRVWMVLIKLIEPIGGTTVNKIVMWDGDKKWWTSGQEITLSYIKHQEINSVITAYGTNGTVIHPMFQQASGSLTKIWQSRLYDAPGGYLFNKAAVRFWGAAEYYSTVSPNFFVSADNEYGTIVPATITGPASLGMFIAAPQAVAQKGRFTGMTIRTGAADMAMISTMLQDEIIEYRG